MVLQEEQLELAELVPPLVVVRLVLEYPLQVVLQEEQLERESPPLEV